MSSTQSRRRLHAQSVGAGVPSLDEAFVEAIREASRPEVVLPQMIVEELRRHGVNLTEANQAALARAIREAPAGGDSLAVEVDETVNSHLSAADIQQRLQEVMNGLPKSIDQFGRSLGRAASDALNETATQIAPLLLRNIRRRRTKLLKRSRAQRREFAEIIRSHWRLALDALECELEVVIELGRECIAENGSVSQRSGRRMRSVLGSLQARGCQIASEVVLLLANGYADGAHARWRSLHEVATLAWFVHSQGERTAHRYAQHEVINQKKLAQSQHDAWPQLSSNVQFMRDLHKLKIVKTKLEKKYGTTYSTEYGWAERNLNTGRGKGPLFAEIEKAVELDAMRPHYGLANLNIHASALAMSFRLGLGPMHGSQVLLAGASPYGLGDPGSLTARSLVLLTLPLLTAIPSIERIIGAKLIDLLANDAVARFNAATKRTAEFEPQIEIATE